MDQPLKDIYQKFSDSYEFTTIQSPDLPVLCMALFPGDDIAKKLPGLPSAALPGSGRVANGRGVTRSECRSSGIGEAIELFQATIRIHPQDEVASRRLRMAIQQRQDGGSD